ncbi:MAG: glycosyltransferase [Kyrpidia sp.]|nr:glycosyltransferase [Kyrpidia sp.]
MLAVLLWIFSIYGFLCAVWHVLRLLSYRRPVFPPVYVLLVVRNAEPFIEGLLRRIAVEILDHAPGLRVAVVDEGSEDNTAAIVERLAAREPWLEVWTGHEPGEPLLPVVPNPGPGRRMFPEVPSGLAWPPQRWIGFDLREGAGLEAVMPNLRALCGIGPESRRQSGSPSDR